MRDASASETSTACFLILFFFNLDDEVFLANEAQRQEYILNQEGIIYQGTENAILAQPWEFSQVSKRSNRSVLSSNHQQRKGACIWCVQDALMKEFYSSPCSLHPLLPVQENRHLCMTFYNPAHVIVASFSDCPL